MLVLERLSFQEIVIGDSTNLSENIVISIQANKNGKYRVGIEAPKHIPVWRREVWDAKKAQGDFDKKDRV